MGRAMSGAMDRVASPAGESLAGRVTAAGPWDTGVDHDEATLGKMP